MSTKYSYTKNPVNIDRLTQEINAESLSVALDYILLKDSALDIYFASALSEPEETTLNGVVTAHTGDPLPSTEYTLVLTDPVWEDISIPFTALVFGDTNVPALVDYTPGGEGTVLKALEFASEDWSYATVQVPHDYVEGTDLKVHIHWTPGPLGATEDTHTVAWKVGISWSNRDSAFPSASSYDLTDTCDGIDDQHQMTASVTVDGTGKKISSQLILAIYRDTGDTWAGATTGNLPLLLQIDLHYQKNTLGSREEAEK